MSDHVLSRLHWKLREGNHHVTRARDVVFLAMHEMHGRGPVETNAIIERVQGEVGRATVYRTLELLVRLGVASELGGGAYELEGHFRHHHHHFTCAKCDKRIVLADVTLEDHLRRMAAERHLELRSHDIELRGLCEGCAANLKTALKKRGF